MAHECPVCGQECYCDGEDHHQDAPADCCHECEDEDLHNSHPMKLGELIGVARECKGWSLRELERRTGISNSLLSQIETSYVKEPSFRNVVKIAGALGLRLDRLAKCK